MEDWNRILTNAETAQEMRNTFGTDGDNWCKGSYEYAGRYCLAGAWMLIENVNASSYGTLARIIREQYPERMRPDRQYYNDIIVSFNDHKDTTFADVRAILEKLGAAE